MAAFKSKKRKALENQPKITGFLKDPNGYNNYFKSHKESLMPSIITGDMDMEDVLEICLLEKENKSIVLTENSIDEKNKPSADVLKMKNLDELIVYHDTIQSSLYSPEKDKWNLEQDDVPIVSQSDIGSSKTALSASTSNVKGRSKVKVCPSYKIIAGTTFCVDGFRFGMIAGVSHYFLTHFHSDHYIGLKKSFNMPLYLSEITCNFITFLILTIEFTIYIIPDKLVKQLIGVSDEYMNIMEIGAPIIIDEVEITAIDANQ